MRNRCPDRTMQTLNRIAPPAATEAATHGRGRLLMQAIITAVIVLATSHAGMVFTVPDGLFFSPFMRDLQQTTYRGDSTSPRCG